MSYFHQYSQKIKYILNNYIKLSPVYLNVDLFCIKIIISHDNNTYLVVLEKKYNAAYFVEDDFYGIHEIIKDCIIHIEIDRDLIKVYQDKLEDSITNELIEAGIPKEKIIILHGDKRDCVRYVVNFKKIYDRHQEYFTSNSNYQNIILKPNLTATELKELRKIDLELLNKAIALHPNTSPDLLKELFLDFPVEVLNNPIIDLLLLENPQFLEELLDINRINIFNRKDLDLPEYFLNWATNHQDPKIRAAIASSHRMQYLNRLFKDSHCLVIQNLSYNQNLPVDISQKFTNKLTQLQKSCDRQDCHQSSDWDKIPF